MKEHEMLANLNRLKRNKRNRQYRARKKQREQAKLLEQLKHDPKRYESILSKPPPPPIKQPDWKYMSLEEYLNQHRFDFCRQAPWLN